MKIYCSRRDTTDLTRYVGTYLWVAVYLDDDIADICKPLYYLRADSLTPEGYIVGYLVCQDWVNKRPKRVNYFQLDQFTVSVPISVYTNDEIDDVLAGWRSGA